MARSGKKAREALLGADAAVAEAVRPHEQSPAVRALGLVSDLGDQPPMRILCGSVIAVGLIGGDSRLTRAGLRMLAAHSVATWAKDYIKRRVDRTRPRAMSKPGKDHRPEPGRDTSKEETSFPSGHSAGAAAVASAFAAEYPEHRLPAAAAAGGLALAQIPRCAHYPTDVGAGLAIGLAADLLVGGALRLWDARSGEKEESG
jgi:membrane-associated phospholipid phosphatase